MRLGRRPSCRQPRARERLPSGLPPSSETEPGWPNQFDVNGQADEARTIDEAIAALEPYMRENFIPAGQVINPLIDVWSVAHNIHPSVARPVEELLTALVSRSTTTASEVATTLDNVRIAALQASVLASA
jgi:hypothetical protein